MIIQIAQTEQYVNDSKIAWLEKNAETVTFYGLDGRSIFYQEPIDWNAVERCCKQDPRYIAVDSENGFLNLENVTRVIFEGEARVFIGYNGSIKEFRITKHAQRIREYIASNDRVTLEALQKKVRALERAAGNERDAWSGPLRHR